MRLFEAAAFDARRIVVLHALHAFVQHVARHFQYFHRYAGIGKTHGDAATHGARADHRSALDLARFQILGRAGDLRHFPFGEEGITQRLGFIGVFQLTEEPPLGGDAFGKRLIHCGFDTSDAVIRRLLVTRLARDGFAHGFEHAGVGAGIGFAVAHAQQRALVSHALGIRNRLGAQIRARRNGIDDAQRFGFCRRHMAARDDHFHGRLGADQTRQALRAAAAGQYANQHFR